MRSAFLRMRRTLQAARTLWGDLNPLNDAPLSFERAQRTGLWLPPVFRADRWLADDDDEVSGKPHASPAADIPPGKFLSLPFASPKDGITGYRLGPHPRGGWHAFHLPWRWIEANLPKGGKADAPEA
jgi:hypothetical protein